MVTVPILGMDLCPRDPNLNLSPLMEMSHNIQLSERIVSDLESKVMSGQGIFFLFSRSKVFMANICIIRVFS